MEDQLKKLPLRSVRDDYADRVMNHIAQAQYKRRVMLMALGAVTLVLMTGIVAIIPDLVDELFVWFSDPFANLAPWRAFEEQAMSNLVVIALVLGIGLCGSSTLLLARLNEHWTGVTT